MGDKDYADTLKKFLAGVEAVGEADLRRVADTQLRKLFADETSRTVVVCKAGKEEELAEGLKR